MIDIPDSDLEAKSMSLSENQFNLIDEPWIRVRLAGLTCKYSTIGLASLFQQATDIEEIDTGNPMSNLAVLRLALSIAHASLANDVAEARASTNADASFGQIRDRLFDDDETLSRKVQDYLAQHHEEFWLLGDNRFGQDLTGDEEGLIASEHMEGIANRTFRGFGTDLDKPPATFDAKLFGPMSLAEAALAVVTMQSFNIGGKKFLGEKPSVSENRGAAYGGMFAHIGVKGLRLSRTLLMNLSLESIDPSDRPIWDYRSTCDYYPWRPTGYISATAPNSRILIMAERDGTIVASVIRHREKLSRYMADGSRDNVALALTAGTRTADGGIKGKIGGYPIGYDPFMATVGIGNARKTVKFAGTGAGRLLRRSWLDYLGELSPEISTTPDLEALIRNEDDIIRRQDSNQARVISMRPLSIELVRRLVRAGYVRQDEPVRLFASGLEFSDGFESKIVEQHYDELTIPSWLFDRDYDALRQLLIEAYISCNEVIQHGIYVFGMRLAYAKGDSPSTNGTPGLATAFADLLCNEARFEFDKVVAERVACLTDEDRISGFACHDDILNGARKAFQGIVDRELDACGGAEIIGHDIPDGSGGMTSYTAAYAERAFKKALRKWLVYIDEDNMP